MPNWCENKLIVFEKSEKWLKWLGDDLFSFNRIIPVSENATTNETTEKWGTKWDIDDWSAIATENLITDNATFFDTAWAPPIKVIAELAKQFPELSFDLIYCEIGDMIAGVASFANGELISHFQANTSEEVMLIAKDTFGYDEEEYDEDSDESEEDPQDLPTDVPL